MKTSTFLVMGACALGLFASAFADGETASATWFAENATSVSTALSGGGSTPSGTWSNLADQVQVKENVIEVDADDEQTVGYAPKVELKANASSVTLSNVVFVAARKTLPAIEAGTQAAVAVTTNEAGSCVFAVAVAGEWVVTTVSANPEEAYTIRCDFTYGGTATVNYFIVDGETETPLLDVPAANSATAKVTTVKFAGSGSFTALDGDYPVATIDFGTTLPKGVASVTVNGAAPVDGKATVPVGTRAVIEFTAADGWSVAPKTITLESVTGNVDYTENFPTEPRESPWRDGHEITSDQIGVCSWTWHGSISNALEQMKADGRYNGMQLALAPWLGIDSETLYFGTPEGEKMWEFIKEKMESGELNVMSTMINFPGEDYTTLTSITNTQGYMYGVKEQWPDREEHWKSNLFYTAEAARLTAGLGVKTLTTESGFICIDEDLMFDRVKEICATCRVYGVDFLIESGPQHSQFMTNLLTRLNNAGFNNVGVNFDPGDTALFGPEDPVESFWTMKPWIRMIHAKDCKEFGVEGGRAGWNEDCVWGDGYVSRLDFGEGTFLDTVRALGYTGDVLYERLSGDETLTENRIAEISLAMDRIIGTLTEDKGTEDNPWFVGKTVDDCVYAWTDDDERLSVVGDGEMADFATTAPWAGDDVTECLVATGVTAIGVNAFAGCQNLGTLVLKPMTPPALGEGNDLSDVNIYVPAGAAETYRAAWPAYADRIDEMRSERAEVTTQLYEVTYKWWDANRAEATGEKLAAIMELLSQSDDGDDGYFLPYDIFNWYGNLGGLDELAKWAERLPALCTSCRIGNFVGRNFDWAYDDVEECVMRVPAAEGRLASIGVASRFFPKALQDMLGVEEFLPELTMDGINEKGVAINVNVVPAGDNGETTGTNEDSDERLCAGFAVRTVLDNATSAAHAVEILKSKDIYSIKGLEFHWMISDAEESYIVECVENELVVLKANDAQPKMSNFYVSHSPFLDEYEVVSDNARLTDGEHTPHAMGIERYENVKAGLANVDSAEAMFTNMTNVWYKPKYLPGNERRYWSDLNGAPVPGRTGQRFTAFDSGLEIDTARSNAFKSAQANYVAVTNYEATTGKRTIEDGYPLTNGVVHTVHTSIYDLANRTLKVCVQEVGTNVFDFALSPVWQVVTDDGNATNGFETLSAALAALQDGDTLMPAVAGDGAVLEGHPTTFDKDNLNAVPVDCPFVITKNGVTVDFRGRVLRDAKPVADERPFLIWVEGAAGVKIQNGFFFGTTWRAEYELSPTDYRGFRVSGGSSVSVEGCAVFIAATTNSVNVLDESTLAFSGCWIDGQGDGAERVFHAAGDSTITIKDTKGLWNPENFWGITDGVEASLPAITGEQFTLEASSLYLDNTIISNTVTHWSEGGKVATPVTFSDVTNALSLANGASITATTGNVAVAKIALTEVGVKLYSDADFAPNDEIVGGADGVKVGRYQQIGSSWKWIYLAEEAPSDPLPHPDEVPTDADVVKVMADAAPSLKAQIKTVNDYTNFYAWVESASLDHTTAKRSKDAFFSFATDQDGLVDTVAVSNGAVKIVAMKTFAIGTAEAPTNMIGVAVKIKGIDVGDAAKSEFLKRVFGAEGAYDLNDKFSWKNVAFVADEKGDVMTPQEGCVIFFVVPYTYTSPVIHIIGQETPAPAAPSADKFFLKVTVNPCNAEATNMALNWIEIPVLVPDCKGDIVIFKIDAEPEEPVVVKLPEEPEEPVVVKLPED